MMCTVSEQTHAHSPKDVASTHGRPQLCLHACVSTDLYEVEVFSSARTLLQLCTCVTGLVRKDLRSLLHW